MTAPPETFGDWLAERRATDGSSLRAVAEPLGVSYELIRLNEIGRVKPTVDLVVRAATHWNFNAWELLAYYGVVSHDALLMLGACALPKVLPQRKAKR